jgi:electron transfer flavoprotein alpha subunit
MGKEIWVYIDQFKGKALAASWESLAAAKSIAGPLGGLVTALVLGPGAQALAGEAFHYGADAALWGDDATLADYRPEAYGLTLAKLAKDKSPQLVIIPATTRGRDLSAMVSAELGCGAAADATALEVKEASCASRARCTRASLPAWSLSPARAPTSSRCARAPSPCPSPTPQRAAAQPRSPQVSPRAI